MISLRALFVFRLFAAALLATIGLQAVPAAPLAPVPVHGSAFSSSTAEVAVLNLRRDIGPSAQQAPEPLGGPLPAESLPRLDRKNVSRLAMAPPAPRATAIPRPDLLPAQARPRAPPQA